MSRNLRIGALVLAGLACGTVAAAQGNDRCAQAAYVPQDATVADIGRVCELNRSILQHCKRERAENIMQQPFAQNILAQLVEAELKPCRERYEQYAKDMAAYQTAMAEYERKRAEYDAFWASRMPSGSSDSGQQQGLQFGVRFCYGDCPEVPPRPVEPSSPACESDPGVISKRVEDAARRNAAEVLERDMETLSAALDHDCRVAVATARDRERQQAVEKRHKETLESREKELQRRVSAEEEDRRRRETVQAAVDRHRAAGSDLEARLGPIAPVEPLPLYSVDPEAYRAPRIRYGVDPRFAAAGNGPGDGDTAQRTRDEVGPRAEGSCARIREDLSRIRAARRWLEDVRSQRAPSTDASSQAASEVQLEQLKRGEESLVRGLSSCSDRPEERP